MRRIIVITGNGKGKTTSALGSAIRAKGRSYEVFFYQFIKSKDCDYGEHLFFEDSEQIRIKRLGLGCKKDFKYGKEDKNAATNGLKKLDLDIHEWSKTNKSNAKALVVLDEVSYPISWLWFTSKDLIKLMDKYPEINFILTGRDMSQDIVDIADTVSSIQEVKHAYQKGVKAQSGIEF